MRPIPPKLRQELSQEERMRKCALRDKQDEFGLCMGRIEWHHTFTYAGKQINERWSIIGVCHNHHEMVKTNRKVKENLEKISLSLATKKDLEKYPRKKWYEN